MYKEALKNGYRYSSAKGYVTTQDLFQAPLTGVYSLDAIAQSINKNIKGLGEESFVADVNGECRDELTKKLDILKDIIADRLVEQEARKDAAKKKARRDILLRALENVENAELASKSKEELLKELEKIDEEEY